MLHLLVFIFALSYLLSAVIAYYDKEFRITVLHSVYAILFSILAVLI